MSLWAVTLVLLAAPALGRELEAPKKLINGSQMLEDYFSAINFTNTFQKKLGSRLARERKLSTRGGGTVFTLTDSERFSFTNPSLGYDGLSVFYSNQFEIYTLAMMVSGTNYVEGGYRVYGNEPSLNVKNHLTKVQYSDVDGLCAVGDATAYSSNHKVNTDELVLSYHIGHFPWIKMQKPFAEGSTSSFCGFLTANGLRVNVEWDLCNNQHYYVCQKLASKNLPVSGPSSDSKHKGFSSHGNTITALLEKYSPHTAAKLSSGPGAQTKQSFPDTIGDASQRIFFGDLMGLREVTAYFVAADITYKPLDYQLYMESSNKYLKYFLEKVTWDAAVAACATEGATLYAPDHSVELDTIMAHFYPLLTPWMNVQKLNDAQSSDRLCGILRVGYVGPALAWEPCTNLMPYICEKTISIP